MLNKTQQKKWLLDKTVKQNRQLEKESLARAKNKLKQNPVERGKTRKGKIGPKHNENNETTANNFLSLIALANATYANSYDVIHITEWYYTIYTLCTK